MEKLMNIASCICNRYMSEYGQEIDEMKLHKLLYFAQRESLIQTNAPLFEETFYGWKFGPILKEVREAYKNNLLPDKDKANCNIDNVIMAIMDKVFKEYAPKDSWSLSRLTHGETSWKKSRNGISDELNSDNPIKLEDIREDAERIRARREGLSQLGLV